MGHDIDESATSSTTNYHFENPGCPHCRAGKGPQTGELEANTQQEGEKFLAHRAAEQQPLGLPRMPSNQSVSSTSDLRLHQRTRPKRTQSRFHARNEGAGSALGKLAYRRPSGLRPLLQSGWYHQHTTTRTANTEDAKEVGISLNTFDGIGP